MAKVWPFKDPNEVADYSINWLGTAEDPGRLFSIGDTIASSVWTVDPVGITMDSIPFTTTTATVWLSGGVLDQTYVFTNRITTGGGRTFDQSVKLKMKTK